LLILVIVNMDVTTAWIGYMVWSVYAQLVFLGSWVPIWRSHWRCWYDVHTEPPFMTPYYWNIGAVWSVNYFLMATASYLFWSSDSNDLYSTTLIVYVIHVAIVGMWQIPFFYWKLAWWSLLLLFISNALAIICLILFKRSSEAAFWVFLPYVLWAWIVLLVNAGIGLKRLFITKKKHSRIQRSYRLHSTAGTPWKAIWRNRGIHPDSCCRCCRGFIP